MGNICKIYPLRYVALSLNRKQLTLILVRISKKFFRIKIGKTVAKSSLIISIQVMALLRK